MTMQRTVSGRNLTRKLFNIGLTNLPTYFYTDHLWLLEIKLFWYLVLVYKFTKQRYLDGSHFWQGGAPLKDAQDTFWTSAASSRDFWTLYCPLPLSPIRASLLFLSRIVQAYHLSPPPQKKPPYTIMYFPHKTPSNL